MTPMVRWDSWQCGNLNVQMSKRLLKRKDELGSMAKSLQLLQNELRNIIEKIQSASNELLTAGVQLGDMSAQTSENASEDRQCRR